MNTRNSQWLRETARRSAAVTLGLFLMVQATPLTALQDQSPNPVPEPNPSDLCLQSYGSSNQRNVLLIIMDDVGVDQIQRYVDYYSTETTSTTDDIDVTPPETDTITSLAAAGVTFVNAWSSPACSMTRAGVYTGTYSFRNGVHEVGDDLDPATTTTIAEVIADAGYTSGLFGKWHLGEADLPTDSGHGWNQFYGSVEGQVEDYYEWTKTESTMLSMGVPVTGETTATNYATWENVDDAIAWINARSGPWMATVAFNAAHWVEGRTFEGQVPPSGCGPQVLLRKLLNSDEWLKSNDKTVYEATIGCLDDSLADLLDSIDSSKLEDTTIILTGDNGTESSSSMDNTDFEPFEDRGKGTIYEGGVNVPFIIADGYAYLHEGETGCGTGRVVDPGRYETALVQTLDIFATVADIADADGSSGLDSVSLVPLLAATSTSVRDAVFMQKSECGDRAVRGSNFKLLVKDDGTQELFNLQSDRWEENELLVGGRSFTEKVTVSSLCSKMSTLTGGTYTCTSEPKTCP